jgi:hypothetical protein
VASRIDSHSLRYFIFPPTFVRRSTQLYLLIETLQRSEREGGCRIWINASTFVAQSSQPLARPALLARHAESRLSCPGSSFFLLSLKFPEGEVYFCIVTAGIFEAPTGWQTGASPIPQSPQNRKMVPQRKSPTTCPGQSALCSPHIWIPA